MMKKMLSALLCGLVLISCLCGALAEAADLTGNWYLTSVTLQGMSLNPSDLGMEVAMVLEEGGVATMTTLGIAEAGVWSVDGDQVSVDVGGAMVGSYADGLIHFPDAATGMTLSFSREQPETDTFVPAAVRTDLTAGDFDGTWSAVLADMMGLQMSMANEDGSSAMMITIKDGHAAMYSEQNGEQEVVEMEGSFENSVMTFGRMPLVIHADGLMSYTETEEDAWVTIYFKKIAD